MRVAVLAGGRSSEHDVSLASARSVLAGLEAGGHEVESIVIDRSGVWRQQDPRTEGEDSGPPVALVTGGGGAALLLVGGGEEPGEAEPDADIDVFFPVLHGPYGEDGTVQGLLECADAAYVGAGVLASALCMDKAIFKSVMAEAGIPQVSYTIVEDCEWEDDADTVRGQIAELGYPVFVKPARLGSSVGISKASTVEELGRALTAAFAHDPKAIVEAAAVGLEVECSVLGNDEPIASQPGEIIIHGEWYDYGSKYEKGGMDLVVPAPLADRVLDKVRELAAEVFQLVECTGLARIDFFVTEDEEILVNELNTIPGFTETSVFARLFEASGIEYVDLLNRLLELALDRHEANRQYQY